MSMFVLATLALAVEGFSQEPKVVGQCQEADYVDGGVESSIAISGRGYTPRCLRVPLGASVVIQATGGHPLQGVEETLGVRNPFFSATGPATAPVTQRLTTPGFYPYFCVRHGTAAGTGMAGVIRVE